MSENLRETFRVYTTFEAELFHEGRVVPCTVTDISAGGARVESGLEMPSGAHCTLGLRLEGSLEEEAGMPYVSFHMEVLEATEIPGGERQYRMRNMSGVGSKEHDEAMRVVFAAQRRQLAQRSGTELSSAAPHDDPEPRRRPRSKFSIRFGRGSTR